ncbi:MAG: hypothetical protein RL595_3443 [Planctomycetota bacterium]
MKSKSLAVMMVGVLFLQVGSAFAEAPTYTKDIQPFLTKYCVDCHGANKPKAGYRLDSYDSLTGKGRKASVVPGEPDKSKLVMTMTGQAKLMPPKKSSTRPTADEIEMVKTWVKNGAKK